MFYAIVFAAMGLASAVTAPAPVASCGSFVSKVDAASLDLAPPTGFVEICGQDAELCRVLTAGYPPTAKTLGYFVTSEEWMRFKKQPIGFTRYLIAQLATSMAPEDLAGLKEHIRSQQANIPDHTELPAIVESQGRAPIAIFEDADDAIAFGAVMKLRTKPPSPPKDATLASTNAALVMKGRVMSLYAFIDVTESKDVDAVKNLTRNWLQCLRAANRQ